MKIRVSLDIEIPEEGLPPDPKIPNYEFNGFTWLEATLRDVVYESFVGYAYRQHLMDAFKWECKAGTETEEGMIKSSKNIAKIHSNWGKLLEQSMETYKIEIL